MARKFHRKRALAAVSEINMTPLIDLAFSLLIIFMITTPLLEQTIEIDLPDETARQQPPQDIETRLIEIDQSGAYVFDGQTVTVSQMQALLAEAATLPVSPVISIRGDGRVPYQAVIDVIDLLNQHKLTKLHLVTEPR